MYTADMTLTTATAQTRSLLIPSDLAPMLDDMERNSHFPTPKQTGPAYEIQALFDIGTLCHGQWIPEIQSFPPHWIPNIGGFPIHASLMFATHDFTPQPIHSQFPLPVLF